MRIDSHSLVIRRAAPEDFEVLYAIMQDASKWLASRGIDQWSWVSKPVGIAFLRKRLETVEVYLAIIDDVAVATISLQTEDAEIWGERGRDGLAIYVHGLAVMRRAAGRELGAKLLDFAGGIALASERSIVRLDCMQGNENLRAYYLKQGFSEVGEHKSTKDGFDVALFERRVESDSNVPQVSSTHFCG